MKRRLTKRSKELNQADLREKSVGRLTKIKRHTFPQYDADELDSFLWQTRSLKGYSFLNGVAYCATNGWIILIGDHGAPREGIKPISNALYGLYVCRLQYTPIAPQFLSGKRTFAFSWGALDAGESAAFSSIFLASSFFCCRTESTPAPVKGGKLCTEIAHLERRLTI